MIDIIPGILEQEFLEIKRKIRLVEPYVSWVQIDVLDGTLFNNTCFNDSKPFSSLSTPLSLEAHLMVKNPSSWIDKFNLPLFRRFIGHIEGFGKRDFEKKTYDFITKVKGLKKEVALAVDLPTPVERIFPFLDRIDQVLVMTINTGRSGQSFAREALEKIKRVRNADTHIPIEVDGGINEETALLAVAAGATRLAATSSIFGSRDVKEAINRILPFSGSS